MQGLQSKPPKNVYSLLPVAKDVKFWCRLSKRKIDSVKLIVIPVTVVLVDFS